MPNIHKAIFIPFYFTKNWNSFFNIYIGVFIIVNQNFIFFHIVLL
jgi:hypothetical protein